VLTMTNGQDPPTRAGARPSTFPANKLPARRIAGAGVR
jgi:hypothetical protein